MILLNKSPDNKRAPRPCSTRPRTGTPGRSRNWVCLAPFAHPSAIEGSVRVGFVFPASQSTEVTITSFPESSYNPYSPLRIGFVCHDRWCLGPVIRPHGVARPSARLVHQGLGQPRQNPTGYAIHRPLKQPSGMTIHYFTVVRNQ